MKKTLFTLILLAFVGQLSAQTLFTVGEKAVSVDEFLYVYGKNKDIGNQIDPKTPEEYLGLYIAFKRKVAEAEALGRDTLAAFLTEYNTVEYPTWNICKVSPSSTFLSENSPFSSVWT